MCRWKSAGRHVACVLASIFAFAGAIGVPTDAARAGCIRVLAHMKDSHDTFTVLLTNPFAREACPEFFFSNNESRQQFQPPNAPL